MDFSNIASFFPAIISIVIGSILLAGGIYLFSLIVKALKTYTKSKEVRREKKESQKSLGEVIRKYRTEGKMSQEFVAEYLGVSRQAVSKWESGISDPSTSNLIALAKLFGTTSEELLKKTQE